MKKALIVIDAQNDYLTDGRYPLWNIDNTVKNIKEKLIKSINNGDLIVFIQHVSPLGSAFFEEETYGVELISSISELTKNAVIIQKKHADSFDETNLSNVLQDNNINEIDIIGMMTQNCVLFTALSEKAQKYNVNILADCCTSVSPVIHAVAMRGLSRIEKINLG
ncbi:isochorismatase family protein [Xenorhabdus bovienii]|uniref:isochorismatase family protein n=1 Tax=Xenorhabdus bovienii TaxID=40576 RepID=UPI0023B271F8|nr:isochorismatase family protein [Xenorhabdus bovienii]MDE9541881.1 isochorismatase family protein [Xenorhabdus bovienii]MDE9557954.1 isochorismatase family protein [Xenorhabdus bovienii]MDE9562677.1 isochorismatase family protein [Xenorhabdus bovienii]